jgi:hypothetical protein
VGDCPLVEDFEKTTTQPGLWVHPHLQFMIYIRHWYARQGFTVPVLYQFCVKDEDRPNSRVLLKYSRYFNGAPIDHQIFSRMIIGYFMSELEKDLSSDCKIGINPYSSDWKELYYGLKQYNDEIISQDVDGWDICFPVNIFCLPFINALCRRFQISRSHVWIKSMDALNKSTFLVHVMFEDQIFIILSMPSGVLVTCLYNSIENSAEHRCIFRLTFPEFQWQSSTGLNPFDEHVGAAFLGDDSNVAPDIDTIERYNGITLGTLRKALFNHNCTEQDKTTVLRESIHIDDAIFLQRGYVLRDGLVYAPLNPESLHAMVQWIKNPKDKTFAQQFAINVDTALMEWAEHGESSFELHKKILNPHLRRYGDHFLYKKEYSQIALDKLESKSEPMCSTNFHAAFMRVLCPD